MTQQFKFGDRVHWINNPGQFIYLEPADPTTEAGWIISEGCGQYLIDHINLEPIPHPDTERIDWLAAQDDISITFGNAINLKLPDLRTAIDIAIQACIEAVAIKFAAHFEEMVARGEAERLPDGRYRIFEKAT
jgi:hypothetical protein